MSLPVRHVLCSESIVKQQPFQSPTALLLGNNIAAHRLLELLEPESNTVLLLTSPAPPPGGHLPSLSLSVHVGSYHRAPQNGQLVSNRNASLLEVKDESAGRFGVSEGSPSDGALVLHPPEGNPLCLHRTGVRRCLPLQPPAIQKSTCALERPQT